MGGRGAACTTHSPLDEAFLHELRRIAGALEAQLEFSHLNHKVQVEMLKLSQDAVLKQRALEETLQAELKRQRMADTSWFVPRKQ
jgi:hypothetical protein